MSRREASSDDSPTEDSSTLSPSSATQCGKKEQQPQDESDGSSETSSHWLSPFTNVIKLETLESPVGQFVSPTSTDSSLGLTGSTSTQNSLFDFNSIWQLSESSSSSALKNISKVVSSISDGARLECGFSLSVFDPVDDVRVPHVSAGLQTPLDEQATCYFLSNFVLSLSTGQGPSLFNFVLRILRWENIDDTPFPMAFTAVSLAALAGRPNSRHLLSKSRIYYSVALTQLKDVLKDKRRAKHDTSLAAAILLSFYEVRRLQEGPNTS